LGISTRRPESTRPDLRLVDGNAFQSSRVTLVDQPGVTPLTEPCVRTSYTTPGTPQSLRFVDKMKDADLVFREIDQSYLIEPSLRKRIVDQRACRVPLSPHGYLQELTGI